MILDFNQSIYLELYIMDLCESINPKKCEDLENLTEEIFQIISMAVEEYIRSDDNLDIKDYNPIY